MRRISNARIVQGLCAMLVIAAAVVATARSAGAPTPAQADTGARAARILSWVAALASDELEGRAPGTPGEAKTVAYLVEQFKALGLRPGNPDGTYTQEVPLIAFTGTTTASYSAAGRRVALVPSDDYIAVSRQGRTRVSVAGSDLVFVGYGVVAPEHGWDDYKGLDVRGKTLVMLVGDPPVPDPANPGRLDPGVFRGAAMTYYGRWPYKYEIAAAKGAAATLIVHETGPAGYGWDVVRNMGRENFNVAAPDLADRHAPVDAWIHLDRARDLFAQGGLDYDALKAAAATPGFRPVALGATFDATVTNTIRPVKSANVVALLEGSDPALRHECVVYSAHWDHFGRNPAFEGDQILNGALDNASGVAEMLAIAERLSRMSPGPRRSILFLSPTAEEATMLGARHYARNPLWPLERTLANINLDIMNFWGPTRAIVSIALGLTTLDEILAAEAAKQGRIVLPDPESEKGYFYRSDHFELAKQGVPALHFLHPGAEYRDRPAGYGQQKRDDYTTNHYHKVSDDVKADWDLRGAVEDVDLLTAVGLAVANGSAYPEWKPGAEFKAVRERSLAAGRTAGPAPSAVAAQVRAYRVAHEAAIVRELADLLAIPNIATDHANIRRNADALKAMLERRGVRVQFFPIAGRGPVVFGELPAPGATKTVVFYAHYDGQPVDEAAWTGSKPFEPLLRTNSIEAGGQARPFPPAGTPYEDDWRIYARSASDDKSPIVALVGALDALAAAGIPRAVNLKFILDSEEEAGSPNLEGALAAHRDLVSGDVLITCDGPVHQSGLPLIFYGNRGITDLDITVYGPVRGLHSGHYGNWAPNPAMRLAQLLASMKDDTGRVRIAGFYDDVVPLTDRERAAIDALPHNDAELKAELQFGEADGAGRRLADLIAVPSLNVRGIRSAYVGGQAQNVVPERAEASLDIRLVKDVLPERQFERVVAHIRGQGYHVVSGREPTPEERRSHPRVARVEFGGGYPATRTSMDLPVSVAVARVLDGAFGGTVVKAPTLGGSVPMHVFDRLGLPVIGVPIVNYDNSQHSHNENLRLGHFWRGIETYAVLMATLAW